MSRLSAITDLLRWRPRPVSNDLMRAQAEARGPITLGTPAEGMPEGPVDFTAPDPNTVKTANCYLEMAGSESEAARQAAHKALQARAAAVTDILVERSSPPVVSTDVADRILAAADGLTQFDPAVMDRLVGMAHEGGLTGAKAERAAQAWLGRYEKAHWDGLIGKNLTGPMVKDLAPMPVKDGKPIRHAEFFQQFMDFRNDPARVAVREMELQKLQVMRALREGESLGKSLQGVLEELENRHGFAPVLNLETQGIIPLDQFATLLRTGSGFHDVEFLDRAYHGVERHRIDLAGLMLEREANPSFLHGAPSIAELYRELGNPDLVELHRLAKGTPEEKQQTYLWLRLFDDFGPISKREPDVAYHLNLSDSEFMAAGWPNDHKPEANAAQSTDWLNQQQKLTGKPNIQFTVTTPGKGKSVIQLEAMNHQPVMFGSGKNADVRLPGLDEQHAQLLPHGMHSALEALQGGVRMGERKLEASQPGALLNDGSTFHIGDHRIDVDFLSQ